MPFGLETLSNVIGPAVVRVGRRTRAIGNGVAEKDDSGTRTIRAAVKSGGTTSDNGSDFALTLNSYVNFQGLFPTDPNSGVAWTVAGVNAAEFGVKTTA